jgi:hypothetical protein
VQSTSTDTTSSNGSQSVTQDTTVKTSDGTYNEHSTSTTDANGNTTETEHIEMHNADGSVETSDTTKTYDANGNLTSSSHTESTSGGPSGGNNASLPANEFQNPDPSLPNPIPEHTTLTVTRTNNDPRTSNPNPDAESYTSNGASFMPETLGQQVELRPEYSTDKSAHPALVGGHGFTNGSIDPRNPDA